MPRPLTVWLCGSFALFRQRFCARSFGRSPRLRSRTFSGLISPNPIGLAAGSGQECRCAARVGSARFRLRRDRHDHGKAQPGNPRPRLFRFPAQEAIINRMGFNNDGADAVAAAAKWLRQTGKWPRIPVGINIGKSKDYSAGPGQGRLSAQLPALAWIRRLFCHQRQLAQYPWSCAIFRKSGRLREIVRVLPNEGWRKTSARQDRAGSSRPASHRDRRICARTKGLPVSSRQIRPSITRRLPKERDEQGGLSGGPLASRSTSLIRILRSSTSLPIIGSGGVMDAASAKEKFDAGAGLVQIYTGFVYRGPQLIREIASLNSQIPTSLLALNA